MSVGNTNARPNFFSRNYALGWALVLVLAAGSAYLAVERDRENKNDRQAREQTQQLLDSVVTDRAALQADLDAASAKIDGLMSGNAALADSLRGQVPVINRLRGQVRAILADQRATREDLLTARIMIYTLVQRTQAYELYIAELEHDNKLMEGQNEVLSAERDETLARNIAMKMEGSILQLSNVSVTLLHERRNGKETGTGRARRGDKLRVMFDIAENRIAESGTREVYIRILSPAGSVLRAEGLSGTMRTIEGKVIAFSMLKDVDLQKGQPRKGVVADWTQDSPFTKGAYKVELYSNGHLVADKTISVR